MCDQAYVNLLREKVRQVEAEERRIATFGTTSRGRFVPWIMPAQAQSQDVSKHRPALTPTSMDLCRDTSRILNTGAPRRA
jgi:hypothetical protein